MHMRVHSVQCNVNLTATWEGLQLTLGSACKYVYFELVAARYCTWTNDDMAKAIADHREGKLKANKINGML